MKKLLCVFLILVVVIMAASSVFAAEEGKTIEDQLVPAAPAENVNLEVYHNQNLVIDNGEIPGGSQGTGIDTVTIDEETIPQGSSLPKTGGIPAEAFYIGGGLLIVAAVVLARKKA